MTRRAFLAALGGAAAWPLAARAQQTKLVHLGYIEPGRPTDPVVANLRRQFLLGLRDLGYVERWHFQLEQRSADGRLETDPVASGVAASLARPGGNISGVFLDFPDFTAKCIEMLVESDPKISRVAVLWDLTTGTVQMESIKKAAEKLNVDLDVLAVQRPSDFDMAFLMASQRGAGAMVMLSSPLVASNVQVLAELALRHRFPAITLFPDFARAGGLLAYGPNLLSLHRLTGVLAGKVLRGANPGELPIERPTKFETVLNLRTAHALGISIPTSLLLRADEVIE